MSCLAQKLFQRNILISDLCLCIGTDYHLTDPFSYDHFRGEKGPCQAFRTGLFKSILIISMSLHLKKENSQLCLEISHIYDITHHNSLAFALSKNGLFLKKYVSGLSEEELNIHFG